MGCRASVEAALQGVAGARQVVVDLQSQAALVVFDPRQADVDAFRAAIASAGYRPTFEAVVEG